MPELSLSEDDFNYTPKLVLYILGLLDLDTLPNEIGWVEAGVDVEKAYESLPSAQKSAILVHLMELPPEISPATLDALNSVVAKLGGPPEIRR